MIHSKLKFLVAILSLALGGICLGQVEDTQPTSIQFSLKPQELTPEQKLMYGMMSGLLFSEKSSEDIGEVPTGLAEIEFFNLHVSKALFPNTIEKVVIR